MMGSHKSENCFKKYPELKRGTGNKRDREGSSKSRSKSRERPSYGDNRKDGVNRVADRDSPSIYREERDRDRDRERD